MRLRWIAKDLGFEKITLKHKIMTAYLVSNQDSEYYQTDTFMKIIRFAASNQRRCKVKELNGKNILYVDAITNVGEALKILNKILEI